MKSCMHLGSAFLAVAGVAFLAGVGRAQLASSAPLQSFSSETSQTTAAFQVPDSWEVRWQARRNVNVAVLAADGSVAGGGAGQRGAVYLPKGGSYHLQIDYDPAPQMANNPNPGTPSAQAQTNQNPYNPVTRDSYGEQQNNDTHPGQPGSPYSNPAYMQQRMMAMMKGPYTVEVISASAADASAQPGGFAAMPSFKLPSGAPGGTTTSASWAGGSSPPAAPAPAATSTAPTPAAPSANLSLDQARAVVLIKGDIGEGTGFLVKTKDGPVVITNQHVIANNPNIRITTSNGVTIAPLSFKAATDRDLAMITIKDAGYSYLTLAPDVTAVAAGDPSLTPGNSEGGEVMLNTVGKVLAIGPDRIEVDNPFYHGNSGGPVYDSKTNQVIGVVTEAIKVDTSDDLDKASFSSRSSAIQGSMRYFAMRVDNVPQWEDIDLRAYEGETAFLDKFDQRSRSLDSYLNAPTPSAGQTQTAEETEAANLWKQDSALMKANNQFEDQSGDGVASGQNLDALHELFGSIVDLANDDVANIKNPNNFYQYDRQRAKDEMDYRQALKDELDRINSNISRLGGLARKD
jgi:S1-C subfamily serine protease